MKKNKESTMSNGVCICGAMYPTSEHICKDCPTCDGEGVVPVPGGAEMACQNCEGTGRIILVE